jgi:DNA-directed RNA polymerase specialized sigma24 family protein
MEGALLLGRFRLGGRLAAASLNTMAEDPHDRSISEAHAKASGRRQISPDNFSRLLGALGDTPQKAGLHYEQLRAKLFFFFTRRSLQFPEDLADEVLDRLGRRLSEGLAISSVDAFALGVARHVVQEQSAIRNQPQAVDPSFFDNIPAILTTPNEDERIAHLERCLRRLPSFEARLLKGYYSADGGSITARRNMAERLGIPPGTLRQRAFLIRRRLLECVKAGIEKSKK